MKSVFHQSLPSDLRDRIILIDTPGIKQNQEKQVVPSEILNKIIGKNLGVKIWIANYTSFADDKERIYKLIDNYKEACNNEIIYNDQIQQEFGISQQNEANQCLDKLIFILNKWDCCRLSEDTKIEKIIAEICEKVGDKEFIYKISSINALKYRIMTFGQPQAQEQFIQKMHLDIRGKKGYANFEESRNYCIKKFQNQQNLITPSSDYLLFQQQLINQIYMKIEVGFNGDQQKKLLSLDCYLEMMLKSSLTSLINQSGEFKFQVRNFIQIIFDQLVNYEKELDDITETSQIQIGNIILQTKLKLKQMKRMLLIRLKAMCITLVQNEKKYKQDIQQLNEKYQKITLNQISQFNIPQGEINELQKVCNRLFTQFSSKQAELIENKSISNFANIIFNTIGVQIDIETKQKLGFISYFMGLVTATSAVCGSAVAETVLTAAELAVYGSLGLAGVGLCVLGIGLLICHREKILKNFKTDELATQNLQVLKEHLNINVKEMSEKYLRNNKQTINCLKSLMSDLLQ